MIEYFLFLVNYVMETIITGDNTKPRTKRMRTSFSDDQVKVLQQHFAVDSNPDGQDLERIAKLTGLKKRVTQVTVPGINQLKYGHLYFIMHFF